MTLIELQAVSGVALAAIGLWYDDFDGVNPVSQDLINVLTYRTGVNANDVPFKPQFPYVQKPFAGTDNCKCDESTAGKASKPNTIMQIPQSGLGLATPEVFASTYPNPATDNTTIKYRLENSSQVKIMVQDQQGRKIAELVNAKLESGTYTKNWNTKKLPAGTYFITVITDGNKMQTIKLVKN